MESGFGDYNIAICTQNISLNCFKFKMALKNEVQNGRQNE